jgi:hypothetical protein
MWQMVSPIPSEPPVTTAYESRPVMAYWCMRFFYDLRQFRVKKLQVPRRQEMSWIAPSVKMSPRGNQNCHSNLSPNSAF